MDKMTYQKGDKLAVATHMGVAFEAVDLRFEDWAKIRAQHTGCCHLFTMGERQSWTPKQA